MSNALLTYPGARAAGPVVELDENALGFYTPNDVPNECIPLIRALLGEVKSRLLPGQPVTEDELHEFFDMIFWGWETGRSIMPPTSAGRVAGLPDLSCHIGVLAEACAASAREAKKPRTRERSTKVDEQKTTKEHRLAGQPVYLAVDYRKVHKFSFSFRDSRSGIISEDQPVHWTNVKSKSQGYLMAMQRHDYFYANQVHHYNMQMAIYIARNRLTWWANGMDENTRPPSRSAISVTEPSARATGRQSAGPT